MPELPEVETIARDLDARLRARRIRDVGVHWARTVQRPSSDLFCACLRERVIQSVARRGKLVVVSLDRDDRLVIHLRMTGRLLLEPADAPAGGHTRVVFHLDGDQRLRFDDARKFGRMQLLDPLAYACFAATLGVEPLDPELDPATFGTLLQRRARVKALLLDQRRLAGIGNIYADEALFRAGIHPARPAESLTTDERGALYHALRTVLAAGVDYRGTSTQNYLDALGQPGRFQERLLVYRRAGQPCPRCGAVLRRTVVGGRTSTFCVRCQAPGSTARVAATQRRDRLGTARTFPLPLDCQTR